MKTFFEHRYPGAYPLNLLAGTPEANTRSSSFGFLSNPVDPVWKNARITPYNEGRLAEAQAITH